MDMPTTKDDPASRAPRAPAAAPDADEPAPEVTPVYLRPVGRDDRGRYTNETLADAITRIVSGMLERELRDSVTAAVRALAPRLVVSLPPDPPASVIEAMPAQSQPRKAAAVPTRAAAIPVPSRDDVPRDA